MLNSSSHQSAERFPKPLLGLYAKPGHCKSDIIAFIYRVASIYCVLCIYRIASHTTGRRAKLVAAELVVKASWRCFRSNGSGHLS